MPHGHRPARPRRAKPHQSPRLLKLSEMVDKACFEVKAFMMEGLQVVEESRKREERKA